MAWVTIDDQFPNHPKLRSVGPFGIALQVSAICYCGQYLTDGFLPYTVATHLIASLGHAFTDGDHLWTPGATSGHAGRNAEELPWTDIMVNAGLWEVTDGGYGVHDYLQYNPSKEEVLARRNADRKRKGIPESRRIPTGIHAESARSSSSSEKKKGKVQEPETEYPDRSAPLRSASGSAPPRSRHKQASKEKPRRALQNAPANPEKVCELLVPCLEAFPTPLGGKDGASKSPSVGGDGSNEGGL